jgi:HEAT repeats
MPAAQSRPFHDTDPRPPMIGPGRVRQRDGIRRWVMAAAWLACAAGCQSKPPYEGKSAAELERMLNGPDPVAQAQGALGLSRLGPAAGDAVPALTAALALGEVGPPAKAAVPQLAELLKDAQWAVRRQAAVALGRIGPDAKPALPGLEKLTKDKNSLVRKAATEAATKVKR